MAVATVAAVLYFGWVEHLPDPTTTRDFPWWGFVALFAVAEGAVAHLEFRREAHSFSLSEIALTIALFLAEPRVMVASYLLGSAVALWLVRRQKVVRLAFNLATFAVAGCLAAGVFATLGGGTSALSPAGWGAAFAAVTVSQLFSTLSIFTVISVSEAEWQLGRLRQIVGIGLSTAMVNTSLGLLIVSTLLSAPHETLLLILPTLMLLAAYRAYTSQRRKHESLGLLWDVSRVLGEAHETETGILALLQRTREALRCEDAELLLFPRSAEEPARVATVTTEDEHPLHPVEDARAAVVVAALLQDGETVMVGSKNPTPQTEAYIQASGCTDAIIAPIRGETRIIGALIVRNRMAQAIGFSESDRTLFETVANHASATLASARLEQSLAQVTELQERLQYQAYHDILTGLPNRALFTERVTAATAATAATAGSAQSAGAGPSVMFIDLDEFKAVNDTLGHAAGDELLAHAATRLTRCVRTDDVVARLGGDEFAVLLPDADDAAAAQSAERIIEALGRRFSLADGSAKVSASVGIAHAVPGYTDAQALLRNADLALYHAKALGKNRHAVFQPGLHLAALERQRTRDELQVAIERGDLVVHYQPYVELRTGRVVGAEALVRWRRLDGTLCGPQAFIPLAEESGLIGALGRNVLEQACRQARTWNSHHPDLGLTVSVNVSAEQLGSAQLYDDVRQALLEARLAPDRLMLEITESTLLQDIDATLERLGPLKDLGIKVAIDDFGTGYSSLAYLRRLPVDVLKLDKSFVDDIADDPDASALTGGIVRLANSLAVAFIAEGVETPAQRRALTDMGCLLGQGYHFARPVSATALDDLLEASSARQAGGERGSAIRR